MDTTLISRPGHDARQASPLHFVAANGHKVRAGARELLFHVPSTAVFELDALESEVFGWLARHPVSSVDALLSDFASHEPDEVLRRLDGLRELGIVIDGPWQPVRQKLPRLTRFPLSTLVLNVNTGCNLSCTYCYKEDLDSPADGKRMSLDTAKASIEMLLAESPDLDEYNLVFFGGEPLSNMPLIRAVVEHARPRFAAAGKRVNFTLTTNATLLTEEIIDWLDAHRFGITVSIDGPRRLHDLRRRTVGGKGSYDTVVAKSKMLLARYRSRPVGARVTLTAGVTEIEAIWQHLKGELGFFEVGFSPVTSGELAEFNLGAEDLQRVFDGMKALGARYRDAALRGENIGFSNLHQLMQDLCEGRSKALPCGAGVGMLAVDHEGGLNLCHRFTGSQQARFGSVADGIDREPLAEFIAQRAERAGKGCETCRIRNLCAGGCYHESYAHFGDPQSPTYHYCDLMRDWIDYGIGLYGELMAGAPQFFDSHIAPRRAWGK
ncbi:MAG: quinohemoprotein amine dehydrogenase maturation protein [Burkholderiaceae bacterium]